MLNRASLVESCWEMLKIKGDLALLLKSLSMLERGPRRSAATDPTLTAGLFASSSCQASAIPWSSSANAFETDL